MLQQVAQVLVLKLDPIEGIEIALQLLANVLSCDAAGVTFAEHTRYRIPRMGQLNSPAFIDIENLTIVRRVTEHWLPLLIADTADQSNWSADAPAYVEMRSYLGVPLFRRDHVFGVLSLLSRTAYAYTEADIQVVQMLAYQFSATIEKAQLFRRVTQRERIADDMVLMGVTLGAILEETELLDAICQQSLPIFGVQGAYLWLIHDAEIVGAAAAGVGLDAFRGQRHLIETSNVFGARIVRDRKPAYMNRIHPPDSESHLIQASHAHSMLGVPFIRGAHVLGALILVDTEEEDRFDEGDLDQLSLFGVQAALAIQNARLFAETRRRLDQLRLVNEVGRIATSILTLGPLMEGVTRPLFDEFHYDAISLLLVENDVLMLHTLLVNRTRIEMEHAHRQLSISGVSGQAVLTGEPTLGIIGQPTLSQQIFRQMRTHPLANADASDWHELAVPLIIAEEVIGILNFERRAPISTEDLDVLEPLAAQIAVTVSNVRLFELVRQQIMELDARVVNATLQLRIEKEHTEAILQSVADAVIMTDLTGQVITANPVAERMLRDNITIDGEVSGSLMRRIRELVSALFNGDQYSQTVTIELGDLALQANAAKVRESGQEIGTVVVLHDITRLQELDRLKTQFVSTVSHELRTPLSNIKLYLQLLQMGKPEKRDNYQTIMENEVNRLERLIVDLLDISRLEQRGPRIREWLDMDAMIHSVVAASTMPAEAKQLSLHYRAPIGTLPQIKGDRDQLTQVLMNLVDNAIHYTPENGSITMSCYTTITDLIVEVSDSGIGISLDDQAHIFDRFFRGQNVRISAVPGTGLGLAICKDIIALHGGTIGVKSSVGQGSTFHFTLPLSAD